VTTIEVKIEVVMNTKDSRSNRRPTTRRTILLPVIAAVLVIPATPYFLVNAMMHATDQRVTADTVEAAPAGQAALPGGAGRMAPVATLKPVQSEGEMKPSSVVPSAGFLPTAQAAQGGSQQPLSNRAQPSSETHLHLVIQISDGGAAEVLSATELRGEAVIPDAPAGDFVYEVTANQTSLAVSAIADPFELRSFPRPGTQGHQVERAKTATISVKVPKMSLNAVVLDQLAVRLYKMRLDAPLERMNLSVFEQLKREYRLELRSEGVALGAAIRQRAVKSAEQ
jgi:hypothetical protein